jgi:signal transduction histidine kinase
MNSKSKVILISVLVVVITLFHYSTQLGLYDFHIIYSEMYFLPIILAGFWFGFKGGLMTSLGITALYLPFMFMLITWQNFSLDELNKFLQVLLFNIVAVLLGYLRSREMAEHEKLVKAESLAAMGRAISGVAHDMKTPLIAIGGFTQLVKKKLGRDDPSRQKLDIVIQETQRLENMVKEMLDFSRPLELDLETEDMNKVVRDSLAVVEETAGKYKVTIKEELGQNLPAIPLDVGRLKQVVINLVVNAVQASPEGETVVVSTSRIEDHVAFGVTDCGCGIPYERREEIFNPFFSTKKEGTGLGLPIVKKIVEAHGGNLEFLDNPEGGVTFKVLIPITKG